jgi:hypothetical protein
MAPTTITAAATIITAAVTAIDAVKKKFNWKGLLLGVVFVLGCFLGGILAGMIIGDSLGDDFTAEKYLTTLALVLISTYGWLVAHIIIHEAGHMVFGLLTGYKFSSFRVFSWILMRKNGKFQLKRYTIPGTGGQCLMIPPELVDGKMPCFLYNMGGCIFNALAVIACVALSGVLHPAVWIIGAVFGVVLVALNGIPRRKNVSNDGSNAFSLNKDPEAVRAFWQQMKMAEATTQGIRMKDMPEEWFGVPTDEEMKNVMQAAQGFIYCGRLLDAQKWDAFKTLADHILSMESGLMGIQKDSLACNRITCELLTEGNREVVENLLTDRLRQSMKALKACIDIARAEYAIALLYDKDEAKARKHLAAFEKAAKNYAYTGELEGERELIAMIRKKAENQ